MTRVPDAGSEAVLRRHLLPAESQVGPARVSSICSPRSRASGSDDRARVDFAAAELFDRLKSVTGADGRSAGGIDDRRRRRAGRGGRAVSGGVRSPPRRVRRRAEVSAAVGAAVPAARARAHRRASAPLLMVGRHAARDGARRHARSRRRRLPSLLGRRASGACRTSRRCSTTRRSWCSPTSKRRRPTRRRRSSPTVAEDTLAYVAARPARPGRRLLFGGRRRQRAARKGGRRKKEGAFYVWSDAEIGALLGADADVVRQRFGIEPGRQRAAAIRRASSRGQNLLYTAAVDRRHRGADRTRRGRRRRGARRARGRSCSTRARSRPRPHLDDKVLTSWNGMMIAAFARAARVLPDRPQAGRWLARRARRAASSASTCGAPATARCCAAIATATPRSTATPKTTPASSGACSSCSRPTAIRRGWRGRASCRRSRTRASGTTQDGGWFSTTGRDPSVLLRLKEDYDGAEPSASSVSVLNLLTLAHLTGDDRRAAKAERTLGALRRARRPRRRASSR